MIPLPSKMGNDQNNKDSGLPFSPSHFDGMFKISFSNSFTHNLGVVALLITSERELILRKIL